MLGRLKGGQLLQRQQLAETAPREVGTANHLCSQPLRAGLRSVAPTALFYVAPRPDKAGRTSPPPFVPQGKPALH